MDDWLQALPEPAIRKVLLDDHHWLPLIENGLAMWRGLPLELAHPTFPFRF